LPKGADYFDILGLNVTFPGTLPMIWPKITVGSDVRHTMEKLAPGRTGSAVAHKFLGP